MAPDGVIEPVDVSGDGVFGLLAGLPGGGSDELRLDGLEEGFHHRVVVAVPALMMSPPPDGIDLPRLDCEDPQRRTVMSEIITVGLDLAKNVFQAHGADASGRAVLRKKLRRGQVLAFFG